ncbi:unnamed protein product [Staurois parvus]|uniref:Uncharacterized protein n=1 Tax=Staurois parvus TaxID=386267 RepID=A0ABN9F6U5_9NEOB|nr:unnamed protein product [Staurois parvus]
MRSGHPAVTEAGPGRRGKDNSAEVGAGTCQIQVPAPPPSPKLCSGTLPVPLSSGALSSRLL